MEISSRIRRILTLPNLNPKDRQIQGSKQRHPRLATETAQPQHQLFMCMSFATPGGTSIRVAWSLSAPEVHKITFILLVPAKAQRQSIQSSWRFKSRIQIQKAWELYCNQVAIKESIFQDPKAFLQAASRLGFLGFRGTWQCGRPCCFLLYHSIAS